jgi:protein-S-isoprenylcysteine O-methyltransferase Ste14
LGIDVGWELLNRIAWIACVVYSSIPSFWLLIHPKADYWRARERSPYRVLIPAWIAMWVLLAASTWPWRERHLYSERWMWVAAAPLLGLGAWLYRSAGVHFSWRQLGGLPELMRGQRSSLVTTGIHARMRHPVYAAHLCEMLAWSLGSGVVACYALLGWAVVSGALMLRTEDAELEKRFGAEFSAYRARTRALVPRWRAGKIEN